MAAFDSTIKAKHGRRYVPLINLFNNMTSMLGTRVRPCLNQVNKPQEIIVSVASANINISRSGHHYFLALSITPLSITTLSITTLSMMTLCITALSITIKTQRHSVKRHQTDIYYAECKLCWMSWFYCYAECRYVKCRSALSLSLSLFLSLSLYLSGCVCVCDRLIVLQLFMYNF